jgi:hypothetical protein
MWSSGSWLLLGGKGLHHTPIKLSLMIYFRRFWFRPFTALATASDVPILSSTLHIQIQA